MRKYIAFLLLYSFYGFGQSGKDNFFPVAPEAKSLVQKVDVPVNYSTGVTNYSIPIHNIKLKNINIPITLDYQSSGFKPSEIASNVGLGWELNVGGKITQNVIGQNDLDTGLAPYNLPNNRDFKLPLALQDTHFNTPLSQQFLDSLHSPNTDYTLFENIRENNLEFQPDLFYYSIPNKSGKFFFTNNNNSPKQIPFGKEKIIYNNYKFEIVDIDGVRYIYDIYTENFNYTYNSCQNISRLNGNSQNKSHTFYLSKIIAPSNEIVEFIYDTVKYNLTNDKDYTRYYHSIYGGAEKVTSYYSEITTKILTKIKVNQNYEIEFLYNKYRKDIKGTNQLTATKTLDNIKIRYNNDLETFSFNYGYFGINDNNYNSNLFEGIISNENTNYRLKLKSFQKLGENPYFFSYHNEVAVEKNTPCLDHWGYYSNNCGRYTSNTLFNDLGSSKTPSLETTKSNILKEIQLPTKGKIEFDFELNECSNCNISYPEYSWTQYNVYSNQDDNFSNQWETHEINFTVPENTITSPTVQFNLYDGTSATTTNNTIIHLYNEQNQELNFQVTGLGNQTKQYIGSPLTKGKNYKLVLECIDNIENENKFIGILFLMETNSFPISINKVGGLRIRNIKTKDNNSIKNSRSFEYRIDNTSSGILYEKPTYKDVYSYFVSTDGGDGLNGNQTGQFDYLVQHSRLPIDLFGFNGHHIFYQKVTEKNEDINSPINNIKIEKFFTFYDDLRYGENTYFSKISYNWKRGLTSQINELKSDDIVKKTFFSYRFFDTPAGANISHLEPGNHIVSPIYPNEYHQRTLNIIPWRITTYTNPFFNIYGYNSSKLISAWYYMDKKITEENLNGNILKTEENYEYQNPTNAQLSKVTISNSKGETLETKYLYAHEKGNQAMIDANMISIPLETQTLKNGQLLSKQETVYAKDTTTSNLLLPKTVLAAKGTQTPETKITYNSYDDKGNVTQYTPEGGIPVAVIWGYNKTQPIAKVENATSAQVQTYVANLQTLSNETDENALLVALNTLRTNLPNAMVTTYTHKPLVGVSTITDPKGNKVTYTYDSSNRLQSVKDHQGNTINENEYHYRPN